VEEGRTCPWVGPVGSTCQEEVEAHNRAVRAGSRSDRVVDKDRMIASEVLWDPLEAYSQGVGIEAPGSLAGIPDSVARMSQAYRSSRSRYF